MAIGRVKWFNNQKGYGFIETDESEHDVFVHFSEVDMSGYKTLKESSIVHFSLEQTARGPGAKGVRILSSVNEVDLHEELPSSAYRNHNHDGGHASQGLRA